MRLQSLFRIPLLRQKKGMPQRRHRQKRQQRITLQIMPPRRNHPRIRQILLQQIRAPTAARQTDSKAEMQRLRKPEKLALPHRQRRTAMLLRRLLLARFTSRMQRAIRPSARLWQMQF